MIDKIIKSIVEEKLFDTHTCVIAKVVRVGANALDAQPLAKRKYKDGKREDYPLLTSVPFVKQEATVTTTDGTFNINFRGFEVGDTIVIVFSEKSIDGVGNRKHSLSDGLAVGRITV